MAVGKTSASHLGRAHLPVARSADGVASPVLDRLMKVFEGVGSDIKFLRRSHHTVITRNQTFGAIRETSRGVVLGLYLPGTLVGHRLMDGARFRLNRVSHQVTLRGVDDVDDELIAWVRMAYNRG